jgi:hypothetical protein
MSANHLPRMALPEHACWHKSVRTISIGAGMRLDFPVPAWLCSATNKTKGAGMKKLILAGALALASTGALAQSGSLYGSNSGYGSTGFGSNSQSHSVQGHTTSSGTYVQPHVATNPNNTQRDNFSATGNVNPYTGAVGTRNPRY